MKTIQDAFHVDGINYSNLPQDTKNIIDKASEELKEWETVILSFENNPALNIITKHPSYNLVIQSEFPDDLTGKMVHAFIQTKESFKGNS